MTWRRFFRRASWDRDRAEELRSYLAIETDENIARGMSADAARRHAHLKLGNTVRIREEIHRMNTIGPLETFGRDLRLALRGMRRRPGRPPRRPVGPPAPDDDPAAPSRGARLTFGVAVTLTAP